MRTALLTAVLAMTTAVSAPAKADQENYLGQIILVPYSFCPRETLPTDGRILAINQYTALFSLIGANFGGDGRTSFALPDLGTGSVQNMRYCIVIEGRFPSRP